MPRPRDHGRFGQPTYAQARNIAAKFGGERQLAELIKVSRVTVYRWSYQRPYGSDGLIPTKSVDLIKDCARTHGVLLTAEDWEPRRVVYDPETKELVTAEKHINDIRRAEAEAHVANYPRNPKTGARVNRPWEY